MTRDLVKRVMDTSFAPFIGYDDYFDIFSEFFSLSPLKEEFLGWKMPTFPPYDLKQDGNNYVLEVAVAGYDKKDLTITNDNGVLEIKAEKSGKTEEDKKDYLHKGIARRSFNLRYQVSDETIIKDAKLENGMLSITMEKLIPEKKQPKQIEIK